MRLYFVWLPYDRDMKLENERGRGSTAKKILAFRFIETKIAFVFSSVTPAFVTVPLSGERRGFE